MINRKASLLALPATTLILALAETAAAQGSPPVPAEPAAELAPSPSTEREKPALSGVFTSGRGDEIRICRSREDDEWVMSMKDMRGREATYVLKGEAEQLRPVGVQCTESYGAGSVDIVVDGEKMYGKAERDGKTVEFFRAGEGAPIQTAVNGVNSGAIPGSAEESELRLVARTFAEQWTTTRKMTFSVSTNSFKAYAPSVSVPAEPSAGARASEFSRAGDLSEDEVKSLVETGRGGRGKIAAARAFAQ